MVNNTVYFEFSMTFFVNHFVIRIGKFLKCNVLQYHPLNSPYFLLNDLRTEIFQKMYFGFLNYIES